jgi:uncharacterized delta-60 repeat protein
MNWRLTTLVWSLPFLVAACSNFEKDPPAIPNSSQFTQIDTSFGGSGVATIAFNGAMHQMLPLTDDSILLSGTENSSGTMQYDIFHILSSGSMDTSFGTAGKVTTSLTTGKGFDVQSTGKIVVAGVNAGGKYSVIRLNTDGSADTTFGTAGETLLESIYLPDVFTIGAIAVQADDKILVAGSSIIGSADPVFSVTRLLADGTADAVFGNVDAAPGAGFSQNLTHLLVQTSGDYVIGGTSCQKPTTDPLCGFILMRYSATGSPDTAFGTSGVLSTGATSAGTLSEQSTGAILLGASLGGFNAVLRYTTAGALDSTFAVGGQLNAPGTRFAVDLYDNVIVQGLSYVNSMTLTRYTYYGTLDSTFVNVGLASPLSTLSAPASVGIDTTGRLLVAGMAGDFNGASTLGWAIERFNP